MDCYKVNTRVNRGSISWPQLVITINLAALREH